LQSTAIAGDALPQEPVAYQSNVALPKQLRPALASTFNRNDKINATEETEA
jgi:hypothetical protein